nr:6-phospho-beta-glucosidase [Spelaeicoccus albus]
MTIIGGGGFRVPLIYHALLMDEREPRIDDVTLYDVDRDRLAAIKAVVDQQQAEAPERDGPRVTLSTDLHEAIGGADFIFSAMRVDGLRGRASDEHIALECGVLGQETTGPGGLAYGWRTVPVALRLAEAIAADVPGAQVINFTNPAGMITEAMQSVLGDRVVGICDSPVALIRRAARAVGVDPHETIAGYAGLNHLGWLRSLEHDGTDLLPGLLADNGRLAHIEEARLFGYDWVRLLGALPNEYLYYYYFAREAVGSVRSAEQTRGDFLLQQQTQFYDAVARDPEHALEAWRQSRRERETTYLAELRNPDDEREYEDIAGGGYEDVALEYMAAVMRGEATRMILNVRNGHALPGLPEDAVVEVPCHIAGQGAEPLAVAPLEGHQLGLVQQVKAVDQLTISAARDGDPENMVKAFALHPLVGSVSAARRLAKSYRILNR